VSAFFEIDDVDVFTTGTVGRPGERTFFLQARAGGQRINVKCEKQQVAAVVHYLRRVLKDLPPPQHSPLPGTLEMTVTDDHVIVHGTIGRGYDRSNDRLLIQLEELLPTNEEGEEIGDADDRGHVRLFITRSQADAFCDHAEAVVESGRPTCVWCNNPIDPDGHACPRMN
jgi:uncharacterized repeat protein (TIGR03847 family)